MQQISVYNDGEQYCARLGPEFPAEVAAGFSETPLDAIEALLDALKAADPEIIESLDWE